MDTREGNEGLVHGFRVSGKGEAKDVDHTGLPFIDQIIDSRQGLTAVRFTNFYASRSTNLDHHARSVETNFRIKKAERVNGVPIPQLAYLSLFNHLDDELAVDEGVLFAHLNTPAKLSLHGVGVEYDDIAGVEGLMTPTLEGNGLITFDKKYNPVAIGATEKNLGIFRQLSAVAIPPISLAS